MAQFSNIDGEESATVTFKVGVVSIDRGSTSEFQEILVLGDPDSSNAIANVGAVAPVSTEFGLTVRIAGGPSSLADLAVRAVLPSTAADNLVRPIAPSTYGDGGLYRVAQSSAADLNVTVANYSTTANISSLAGAVTVRSSAANLLATIYPQSSAAPASNDSAVIVRQVGYSTTLNVSSLAGKVTVDQNSTVWPVQVSSVAGRVLVDQNSTTWPVQVSSVAGIVQTAIVTPMSSAAPASGDSGVIVRQVGYSTTHNVSSLAGTVAVAPASSGATGFFAVRMSDGSTYVTDSTLRALRITSVDGSTQVSISTGNVVARLVTDSGGSVMDSTEIAVKVNVVAGAAAGSTLVSVRHVTSSGADLTTNTDPGSTAYALIVRPVGGSTTVNVSSLAGAVITRSSAADMLVTANQGGAWTMAVTSPVSSATPAATDSGVVVRQIGYSTTMQVSSLAGAVIVRSSAADALVTVSPNSTAAPASNDTGIIVRQVGYSTIAAVSSVAGRVGTMPFSTSWVSSAGFHVDSSGAILVGQGSTVWNVQVEKCSSLSTGHVTVDTGSITVAAFQAAAALAQVSSLSTGHVTVDTGTIRVHHITSSGANLTTNTDPASTSYAIMVRQVGGGGSTQVAVSSLAGLVNVLTTGGLNSSAYLPVRLTDGSSFLDPGNEYTDGSTYSSFVGPVLTYDNGSNATFRKVGSSTPLPVQIRTGSLSYQSTRVSTFGNNSTASTFVSSVASQRIKVYAYSITSTDQNANIVTFLSSDANPIWDIGMQSQSCVVSGANLAVTPPAFLFATASGEALAARISGSSGTYRMSFSFFIE